MGRISPRRAELAFTFIAPEGFCHPKTRTRVRLLGPCFKTGRMKPYDRQRPRHIGTNPTEIALQFKYTARSLPCSQNQHCREARPKARIATPLSGPTRSPEAITLSEESYLPRRRIRRSEHSLTRQAEKCDQEKRKHDGDSPSDLHPAANRNPKPEFLPGVANPMRFPTNGFTYS